MYRTCESLFSGCPCQESALKKFLGKEYDDNSWISVKEKKPKEDKKEFDYKGLIETMNDCYEAKAGIIACKEVIENLGSEFDVPIFVTTVYDESARSLTGTNIETMTTILESLGVDGLGMNCSLGPIQMKEFIKDFTENTNLPIIVNPNAGLPRSENGKTVYDISPEQFANIVSDFISNGVSIIGGCCGTTVEYTRSIAQMARHYKPRK